MTDVGRLLAVRADSIHFKGHLCFQKEWAGFEIVKPINVIIGRNNSGKSHLLDLVDALAEGNLVGHGWHYRCSGVLDEASLRSQFQETAHTYILGSGDDWHNHGRHFVGVRITWEIDANGRVLKMDFPDDFTPPTYGEKSTKTRLAKLTNILRRPTHQLTGRSFTKLVADRDIKTEPSDNQLTLDTKGNGATNIIRRFITSSSDQLPREAIQQELLEALNEIFGSDGQFTEIQIQEHDEEGSGEKKGHWEVYLGESPKGLISLTNSGSGLKTVFLVLLNLLVVPRIKGKEKSDFIFGFEELENNLHPALLRRLLQYLEKYALDEQVTIFLTTHSSTALDLFGVSENAQIIHVTHDGETARTTAVSAHFDRLGVVSELGAKPSDLLQANGIVWVEGPSDRVYLNRWIQFCSNGALREGRDYQCAFYGGALLAGMELQPPEGETGLVNLLRVNPNIVVVCDGDRDAEDSLIKSRVERIRAEVEDIPGGHIWITKAREIENYIPGSVLAHASDKSSLPDPGQYESFFPRKASPGQSYLEASMDQKHYDKMELAIQSAPHMTKENMSDRFDWKEQMANVVRRINCWNA